MDLEETGIVFVFSGCVELAVFPEGNRSLSRALPNSI